MHEFIPCRKIKCMNVQDQDIHSSVHVRYLTS